MAQINYQGCLDLDLHLSLHPPSQSPPPPPPESLPLQSPPSRLPPESLPLQSPPSRLPPESLPLQSSPPPSSLPPESLPLQSSPPPPPLPECPLLFLHLPLQSPPSPPPEYPQPPTPTSPPPQTPNDELAVIPQPNNETSNHQQQPADETIEQPRQRRRRTRADTTRIEPPYPWSTDRRAVVQELEYLQLNNILTIKGEVKCRKCERKYEIEYDLMNKFNEIARFIEKEKDGMHNRAPNCWENPILPNCNLCNKEKCVEPVIITQEEEDEDDKFKKINWLFLLLGQFLGCLKLKQLKYFCAQTNIHRTGAKNRLLYLAYLALCKQLQPTNIHFNVLD